MGLFGVATPSYKKVLSECSWRVKWDNHLAIAANARSVCAQTERLEDAQFLKIFPRNQGTGGLHQLQQRKLRIQAALREQFVVGALRDDVAVLDDDDAVGLLISNTGHLKHGTV